MLVVASASQNRAVGSSDASTRRGPPRRATEATIDRRDSWKTGLGVLWHQWWARYLGYRDDPEVLEVVPPFLAWRALVVANPAFYPQLSERGRHALLELAERVLEEDRLDPAVAEDLFR